MSTTTEDKPRSRSNSLAENPGRERSGSLSKTQKKRLQKKRSKMRKEAEGLVDDDDKNHSGGSSDPEDSSPSNQREELTKSADAIKLPKQEPRLTQSAEIRQAKEKSDQDAKNGKEDEERAKSPSSESPKTASSRAEKPRGLTDPGVPMFGQAPIPKSNSSSGMRRSGPLPESTPATENAPLRKWATMHRYTTRNRTFSSPNITYKQLVAERLGGEKKNSEEAKKLEEATTLKGYLHFYSSYEGGTEKSWEKAWFCLTDKNLLFLEDEHSDITAPKVEAQLLGSRVEIIQDSEKKNTFKLICPEAHSQDTVWKDHTIVFSADTPESLFEWFEQLTKAIEKQVTQ